MNPVAQQLAKGGPFAPTSWGAFGPGWLWVAPSAAVPAGVVVDTAAAVLGLEAGVTSVEAGQTVVSTLAAELGFEAGVTSIETGPATITTEAALLGLRAGITSVDGGEVVIIGDIVCTVLQPTATCAILFPSVECEVL